MSASSNSAAKVVGIILYGLVAGFTATTLTILGPMLLALFFLWIFDSLGGQPGRDLAVTVISGYVFITGFGLIVGAFVCVYVWITRFRRAPSPWIRALAAPASLATAGRPRLSGHIPYVVHQSRHRVTKVLVAVSLQQRRLHVLDISP